ncbi:hypothetical protein Zmor_016861 [Zophobas morio]|uniref:Uncharacterized protein n=1 Tax=Zophobas morio TaxID=2755281 RepID=A0AA38MC12_9CUCU|nr:hypothetical protein Zmor_016861 [Zophobas morio]
MLFLHCVILTVLVSYMNCCDLERFFSEKQVSVEESASTSQIVFRGLTIAAKATPNDPRGVFTAHFELINTYKGAETLEAGGIGAFRRINVTFVTRPAGECSEGSDVPREYIIFCNLENEELRATSIAKWDESTDQRVWAALGMGTEWEILWEMGCSDGWDALREIESST